MPRFPYIALGLALVALLLLAWLGRYQLGPTFLTGGAWRLDRWTGHACVIPGPGAERALQGYGWRVPICENP